ncbi:MAG: hypothetical protein QNJ44_05030 [Rhodobacter sp.]|nr:hypothetical protein [Rhodobacter sp.]
MTHSNMPDFSKPIGHTQAWTQVRLLLAVLESYKLDEPRFARSVDLCRELQDEISGQIGASRIE